MTGLPTTITDSRRTKRPGVIPLSAVGLAAVLLLGPARAAADDAAFDKVVAPFLERHCYSCHGPDRQESQVRLDKVGGMEVGNWNLWTMVHGRVSAGEMPPKSRPQPTDAEKQQVLAWIRTRQREVRAGGTRRLNRRELGAALRDVTGLAVDFSHSLPGDGTVAGFDTGADGLQEAADSVAQWLQVTRRAVDGIRFLEPAPGPVFTADLRAAKEPRRGNFDARIVFDPWKDKGVTVRGRTSGQPGVGLYIEPRAVGERDELTFSVVPPPGREGILRVALTVSALKLFPKLPDPHLWVEIGGKDFDFREITATPEQPQRLVYQAHLGDLAIQKKGVTIALSNKVEIPYAVDGFDNEDRSNPKEPIPGGPGLYRPQFDRRTVPPEKQPAPHILLHDVEIEPDFVAQWPPAAWQADVGKVEDNTQSADRLLALWLERAWRRPVAAAERSRFLKLYEKLRGDGLTFDDALRAAFQSVLLSAPFRYMAAPGHPDPAVAQHAVASRLSFMLTGAPPDAELRKLAAAGKLREPAVLDAQTDRLLDGPRSDAFLRPFVIQWLEMEQPITIAQDHIQKQDFRFARHLKASMREETIAYVEKLFAENRPAGELIVSDWTMMNDALALHYGYGGVEGGHMRKVTLRPDDPRGGGILGHAGLQSMLCWMGDNWVIYRGAWALRHILDEPPPPPPLEVPELNHAEHRGKTFRELLRIHQQDSRCAVCHRTIDPVGFAFQNFDLSGRWRDVEHEGYSRSELDGRIAWHGVGKTRPVDAAGELPRGEKFQTFAEFKDLLVEHYRDDLVRGLLKNLMVYATGRTPGVDDVSEIDAIMDKYRGAGYPLRDLVKAVVRSSAFLERYGPFPATEPTIGRRRE